MPIDSYSTRFLRFYLVFPDRHAGDNIGMKEREIKSLQRQCDSTTEDMSETSRSKDIALRENRRLQDDLAVMTRENQVSCYSWE